MDSDAPLEERVDRWVNAGRQLVNGVAGTRPGSRGGGRPGAREGDRRAGRGRLDELGRWVENRLDWLLDDEDDWREPWQEPGPAARAGRSRRPPLDAISRRRAAPAPLEPRPAGATPAAASAAPAAADPADPGRGDPGQDEWPDDDAFTLPRWRRQDDPPVRPDPPTPATGRGGRRLPRSSRRR